MRFRAAAGGRGHDARVSTSPPSSSSTRGSGRAADAGDEAARAALDELGLQTVAV